MTYDLRIRCYNCDRFIPIKASESSNVTIRCSDRKCKQDNTIKVVMLSDMLGQHTHTPLSTDKQAEELKARLAELDGRTKEAKGLKTELENLQGYVTQLEGIIDGQG